MIYLKYFNPDLELIRDGGPRRSAKPTYEVAIGGDRYILKAASKGPYRDELFRERDVLLQVPDVPHVSHFKDWFEWGEYVALLKEYVPGQVLRECRAFSKYKIHQELGETINTLHEKGIAGVEPDLENIIISPEGGSGTLMDFESAYFRHLCGNPLFEYLKQEDTQKLKESLIQPRKRRF
ncbi:MAG: hypothetical protein ACQESG_05325 [Nanobdellota archaeon]